MSLDQTTTNNIKETISIAWETIEDVLIPFIKKPSKRYFTSIHILKEVLFKQQLEKINNEEIFKLACPLRLNKHKVEEISQEEIELLNEVSKESLKISIIDKQHFFLSREDIVQLYKVLNGFYKIIAEKMFEDPSFGYIFIGESDTPIPFLNLSSHGTVMPAFFFECPQLLSLGFALTNHWELIYLKLLCKLLGVFQEFYHPPYIPSVVKLNSIKEIIPEIKNYNFAKILPTAVKMSEFTNGDSDDEVVIIENKSEAIEISSSDEETGPKLNTKIVKRKKTNTSNKILKFTAKTKLIKKMRKSFDGKNKDQQNKEIGVGTSDQVIVLPQNQKYTKIIIPNSTNTDNIDSQLITIERVNVHNTSASTSRRSLIPVKILKYNPKPLNEEVLKKEYSRLKDCDPSNVSFRVYQILDVSPSFYNIGVYSFKEIEHKFVCISNSIPYDKQVYLINVNEVHKVLFPNLKKNYFIFFAKEFCLNIYQLNQSQIEFLNKYYQAKLLKSTNSQHFIELQKFCDVYLILRKMVEAGWGLVEEESKNVF